MPTPRAKPLKPLQIISPVHKAGRQIGLYLEEQCATLGVAPKEGHLLTYMQSYAPCPIGDLHRVFGLKPSTLTSMLDRLEQQECISRTLCGKDRRSWIITLKPRGRIVARKLRKICEELEKKIFARIDGEQMAGYRSVMEAIGTATRITVRLSKD